MSGGTIVPRSECPGGGTIFPGGHPCMPPTGRVRVYSYSYFNNLLKNKRFCDNLPHYNM